MAIQSGLSVEPKTNNELILLTALRESRAEVEFFQRRNLELQAATILNEIYCKDLSAKLAFHEQEKGKKRGEGRKKLMGDGLPVLLTGDYFYERVVEFETEGRQKEREKEARREAREAKQAEAVKAKEAGEDRRQKNNERRSAWKIEVAEWEKAKTRWQHDKKAGKVSGAFKTVKPKLGPLLKAPNAKRSNPNAAEKSSSESGVETDNRSEGSSSE
jgi:hypothetical protein